MSQLVLLELMPNGEAVYVHPHHVSAIYPVAISDGGAAHGTAIELRSGARLVVRGSVEDVSKRLWP